MSAVISPTITITTTRMTIELYRERSYARCIKDGFDFLTKNLWLVTKIMMPYFIVVALLLTVMNADFLYVNVCSLANIEVEYPALLLGLLIIPVLLVAVMLTQGRLFLMYRRLSGLTVNPPLWRLAAKSLVGIVLLPLFFTPLVYVYHAWMMKPLEEDAAPFSLKDEMRRGCRHWAKILGVVLFAGFIFLLAACVLVLPYIAAVSTYFASIEGKVNFNDTALIPTSGYVGMMLLCILAYSLIFLFGVFYQTSLLLLYGDIARKLKTPSQPSQGGVEGPIR